MSDDKRKTNFPKLSHKEFVILEMLIGKGEMYGLEMVEASEGELKRGTIYVTLQRMAEKGFVESREEARPQPEIGIPRRVYKATGLGERMFRAQEMALDFLNLNLEPKGAN
ncbi:MAG TPA: helix-turn-helix transcriptional regulator [Pyrinomonadaceae bacterium]|jgi:DNA-binding PadR family transcriptional regulator